MKIRLTALLGVKSQGVDKAAKKTGKIKDDLNKAEKSSKKLNKNLADTQTGTGALRKVGGGRQSQKDYRGKRAAAGTRKAEGRNFSGLAGMAGGGGGGSLVAGYAEIAANIFAITAAFQALSDAAKVEQLTQGLELMGARGGVALKSVAKDLREVTGSAISTADAMRVVAQASSAGLGQDEITRLGKVARGASLALGRDMSDSMDRLTRGAIKLEPELLDELGIMVRLDQAVKTYAEQNDKAASSLTLTERRQAFLNAVLEEGESKFGEISKQIETNPYDKLSASVRDMGTQFFTLINGPLKAIVDIFANNPFLLIIPGIALAGKALKGLGVQSLNLEKSFKTSMKGVKNAIAADRLKGMDLSEVKDIRSLNRAYDGAAKSATGLAKANVRLHQGFTLLGIGIRGVLSAMGPMLAIMAVFFVGGLLFSGLKSAIRNFQGITKEIVKARKELKDFNDSTAKTIQQFDTLSPGQQFDALVNSLKGARSELKKLQDAYAGVTAEQQTQAKLNKVMGTTAAAAQTYGGLVSGTRTRDVTLDERLENIGIVGEGGREERDFIAQTLVMLEKFAPKRAEELELLIAQAETGEEIREGLEGHLTFLDKITGSFANISQITNDVSKNIKDLLPKELEDSTTKLFDNFKDINTNIEQGANSAEALADEFIKMGSSQVSTASDLVALYNDGEGIYGGTIEKLKQVEALQKQINKLNESNNLLLKATVPALEFTLKILKEQLGLQILSEREEANANAERAREAKLKLLAEKDVVKAKIKSLELDKKQANLQNKLKATIRAGTETSGPEASLVFGILDKTAALESNELIGQRKNLIDKELESQIAIKREQKVALDNQEALTASQLAKNSAIEEEITELKKQAGIRKNNLDLEQQIARQEIENLDKKLQGLASGNAAKKEEIAQSQKILSLEKSIASERQKLASAQLEGERIAAEQAAGPRGLTVQQEADFAIKQHDLKLDNLNSELKFLEKEKDLKIKNLTLEKDIRLAELKFLKEEVLASRDIPEDRKDSIVGSIGTIEERIGTNFKNVLDLEDDLYKARQETLNQTIANEKGAKGLIADTPEARFQQAMGTLPQRGILGLTGEAEAFVQKETRALGPNASKEDVKRIRDMGFQLETATIAAQGFNDVMNSVQSSLEDAFMSLVDGTKSAKQAFADMAKAILAEIARVIVKLLVVKTLQAMGLPIPGAGGGIIPTEPGAAGGIIGYANGGIISPRDGLSGVVKQPTYLVGEGRYNEAVVPLPNGRAIPVQMHGGQGGQQNNVAVTVNMNDNGSTQTESGFDPNKLGQAISVAVQKELMSQKSPGGLLSKYG